MSWSCDQMMGLLKLQNRLSELFPTRTVAVSKVFLCLASGKGERVTVMEIRGKVDLDRSTISKALLLLIRKGLAVKGQRDENYKEIELWMTDKGREIAEQLAKIAQGNQSLNLEDQENLERAEISANFEVRAEEKNNLLERAESVISERELPKEDEVLASSGWGI